MCTILIQLHEQFFIRYCYNVLKNINENNGFINYKLKMAVMLVFLIVLLYRISIAFR